MFSIAICDDEIHFRNNLKNNIVQYMEKELIEYEIDTFVSGKELLSLGIEMIKYDTVFLDINMEEVDGIETAKKIREISSDMFIVFVTAFISYAQRGYGVNAIRYILKSNNNFQEVINECMESILNRKSYLTEKKTFKFSTETKEIFLDRILYIESLLHKLEFHVMEKELKIYTIYEKLSEVDKILSAYGFVRIHQSFLVNLKYIRGINNYKAILSNGIELTIARSRYQYVKGIYIEYMGEV